MPLRQPDPSGHGSLADHYLAACVDSQGHSRIRNLMTKHRVLDLGNVQLPASLNDGSEQTPSGEPNSYVVSPISTYGNYALEELRRLGRPWLFWPLALLLRAMGRLMGWARFDRVLHLNNWLLSTNLYPRAWTGEGIAQVLPALLERYPNHALVFRSLNEPINAALMDTLKNLGFMAVPSRQVYLFDGRLDNPAFATRHNNRIDARLLRKTPLLALTAEAFSDADFMRAEQLYRQLYLDKYCSLNPQYTAAWLRAGRDQGWLQLVGLRHPAGELMGVVGWFDLDDVISAPIVGYDTAADSRWGLYRLLTQLCLQRAVTEHKLLNFSSGAAHFKRLRGGEPAIEYSLVYSRNLPLRQAWMWRLLAWLLQTIAVPLMRKLKL